MTIAFGKACEAILEMGYYKNEHARSGSYSMGHEEHVAAVLVKHDFKEVDITDFPQLKRGILKQWWENGFTQGIMEETIPEMERGTFVLQPGGTQSFPDILVRDFDGRFIAFEQKSSNGTHPMWNDSLPKPGALYVFCSGKRDETTLFMGQDVIKAAELDLVAEYQEKFETLVREYESAASNLNESSNRGWIYKHRKQFFQQGGAHYTNYFTHADRQHCEDNAIKFAYGE